MVTWGGGHAWATNVVRVVTTYEGGLAVTNDHTVTVGMQPEPDTTFSVSCQKVFFLNDAEILADGSWTNNRPERIRPIRVDMRAARGTRGTLAITATGAAQPMLFRVDENGVTNIVPSGARIPLGIESGSLTRETTETFYASCPHTGTAMFEIVCQLEDGPSFATNVTCRVIEPLRRLINVERFDGTGPVVNPSRLVLGTNAILRVGVNGYFPESNVVWKVVSGKANVESHGFWAVVEPTDDAVDPVKVEARFNEDEIQPTFELPVVGVRKIPVRAFRVNPPMDQMRRAWSGEMISNEIARANAIFAQAGILFELEGEILTVGSTNDWIATSRVVRLDDGRAVRLVTEQTKTLLNNNVSSGCVEIYFLGGFSPGGISGFYTQYGIAIGVERTATTLAHELGHALGLADCYAEFLETDEDAEGQNGDEAVTRELFVSGSRDWGEESGRGFYDKIEDTWLLTIQRLLMWSEASETKVDIPDDMVKGALLESDGGIHGVLTAVGVEDIKPANTEVFSK